MLSRKFSFIVGSLAITLLTSGSYSSLAGDASAKGRVSNQFASGTTSANLPHNFFNEPQSAEVRNKPNVPHGIPGGHTKPGNATAAPTHSSHQPTASSTHVPTSTTHTRVECPPGHEKGWIIDEGTHRYMILADGTKIELGQGGATHHTEHSTPSHTGEPHDPLHPLPTKEELELEEKLKPIAPHIFKRADPNHPTAEKRGEWGKALDDKVYFRVLGIWKHDPSVNAKTDIIATSVKDRIKMHEEMKAHHVKPATKPTHTTPKPENKPAEAKPTEDKPAEDKPAEEKPADDKPMMIPKAPPPPPRGGPKATLGSKFVRKAPTVVPPDVLGTTARTNTVQTDPTQGDKRVFSQGAANRAQTGVTGQEIPPADTSETGKPVLPPSGSTTTPAD